MSNLPNDFGRFDDHSDDGQFVLASQNSAVQRGNVRTHSDPHDHGRKRKRRIRGKVLILVAACVLVLSTVPPAKTAILQEDRRVILINHTSSPIYHFYASNVDSDSWEEDILGDKMLRPGGSTVINIDDGTGHCLYDLKAVLRDGREAIRRKFNVCTRASWTVTD